MRCPVCHTDYPPGHQYCMNDGAALLADAPEASGGAHDRVAASLAALDRTIGATGPIQPETRQATVRLAGGALPPRYAPPPQSMHPAALMGIGALAFVLLAAIGFFAFQALGGGGNNDLVGYNRGELLGGNGATLAGGTPLPPGNGTDAGSTVLNPIYSTTPTPTLEPPSSPGSVIREASIPGGTVQALQTANSEIHLVARGPFGTNYAPKPLSTRTRLSGFTHRRLAGRDVVEFEASDGRWRTTYFWEYEPNVIHFVASDQQNGDVNVSRQAYTPDILRTALGYVPQRTWQSREEREAQQAATSDKRFNVVLGAYPPSDARGHAERLRRVQASGNAIRTASSESLGMRPGFRVIYLGPYRRDAAYRVLDEMRQVTGDAYLSNVR